MGPRTGGNPEARASCPVRMGGGLYKGQEITLMDWLQHQSYSISQAIISTHQGEHREGRGSGLAVGMGFRLLGKGMKGALWACWRVIV